MTSHIQQLTQRLSPLTSQIVSHPLYSEIASIPQLRLFMEQHVFAVWDFMCLLKELHRRIVSTAAPWFPPRDALSANLISSILVEEEGDLTENGVDYASHYDIYIHGMDNINADTRPIKQLQSLLMNGSNITEALEQLSLKTSTKEFVLTTFSFFEGEVHELAAAFVYGREGITAAMFSPLIKQLEVEMNHRNQQQLSTLIYYFKRHIELDNHDHFPKALKMLSNLVNGDEKKLKEAENAAIKALTARVHFLTGIQNLLHQQQKVDVIAQVT
ncbi:MAG: DUF3050 domain-containing protein [Legionellales bacterium]|nr:DUF3050 domain-containing protein [Legionellales bacterium]